MRSRALGVLLAAALAGGVLAGVPGGAEAVAGDFDPSFGTAGVATSPPSPIQPSTPGSTLAIDGLGRIVTVGSVYDSVNALHIFAIHRFLPSGVIDDDFGTHGVSIVSVTSGLFVNQVTGVGVQPDGRIVFGARVYPNGGADTAGRYAVLRLTSAGALDPDFDGGVAADGMLLLSVGPNLPPEGSEVARNLSVDETGRILISGVTYYAGPPMTMYATMARLTPEGVFDSTFSGDGKLELHLPTSDSDLKAFADLPGSDGYALGGRTIPNTAPTIGQPTVIRVSESGDLVTGFGSSLSNTPGMSTTYWQGDPAKLGEINALVGVSGGGLVAGGYQNTGTTMAALAKYTTSGGLDPSFGVDGVRLLQIGGGASMVNDLVLQPDGKIVAAMSGTDLNHGFVARFTAAGALDPTFGTGGVVATDPSSGTPALTLQGDRKVVAITPRGGPDTTLVRLLADPSPLPPAGKPSVQVTSPGSRTVKAKKLKALAGTAAPAGQVALVKVALQRVDKRLLRDERGCLWLANHRGAFKEVRATHRSCSQPVYRKAAGRSLWDYGLRKRLSKGKYVLYALARLRDGRIATVRKPFRLS